MAASDVTMTIGELASRSGFSSKTIRYYESIGLMPEPARRPSGYRDYGAAALERLAFLRKAKQLGLSLDEIRQVAALADSGTRPCEHVLALLDAHLARVARARRELGAFERELRELRDEAGRRRSGGRVCGIIEHARIDVDIGPYAKLVRGGRGR